MGALIDILIDFGYWGMLAAAFLAYVQVFLYPVEPSHTAYTIIKQSPGHIANGGINGELYRV